jgi:hypothetical protein
MWLLPGKETAGGRYVGGLRRVLRHGANTCKQAVADTNNPMNQWSGAAQIFDSALRRHL